MIRHLATFACWLALGAAGAALAAVTLPYLAGGRSHTVLSGSMEPAIATGDVVAERRVSPGDLRSGDIVTFEDPEEAGRMITHRVRSARRVGAEYAVVTKGDANTTSERWNVAADGHLGRVEYRVAGVGRVLVFLRSPAGILLGLVLPALLLGALELRRIWATPSQVRP